MKTPFIGAALLLLLAWTPLLKAQDDDFLQRLYINDPFDEPGLCTIEQAREFYATLDEFEQLLDRVADLEDELAVVEWAFELSYWYQEAEVDCYGGIVETTRLEHDGYERLLDHWSDLEALSEQDALTRAREMAAADFEAIAGDEIPESHLALNRAYTKRSLCNGSQAAEFYSTLKNYEDIALSADAIHSLSTLREWATAFRAWRSEAWGQFTDEPCGATLFFITFYGSFAYSVAMNQLGIYGETVLELFAGFMQDMQANAADDLRFIKLRTAKLKSRP